MHRKHVYIHIYLNIYIYTCIYMKLCTLTRFTPVLRWAGWAVLSACTSWRASETVCGATFSFHCPCWTKRTWWGKIPEGHWLTQKNKITPLLCFQIQWIEAWTWCTCWTRPSTPHAPLALGQVGQASPRGRICTPRKAEEAGSTQAKDPACPVVKNAQGSFIIIRNRGCTHMHISHILLTAFRGQRNVCFIS